MEWADIASAGLRGLHLAALESLLGTLVFRSLIAGDRGGVTISARLALLIRVSAWLALGIGVVWFGVRAALIAGAESVWDGVAALPAVAADTQFGQLMLLRGGLLCGLLGLRHLRARPRMAGGAGLLLAAAALGLQPAIGHAGAMQGTTGVVLLAAEALHILAAGAWLGSLLPLLICLRTMPSGPGAEIARRFFPLGLIAVASIALTSVVQAIVLVASVPALIGTDYGRMAVFKLVLFAALLGFAALNRFRFAARPTTALRRSVAGETMVALGVTVAAGFLAHLTPGAHGQPVWPLAWRIDLTAKPSVFVAAYPSSFFVSPTGFSAVSIVQGQHFYAANCAGCHGVSGHGDGPRAAALPGVPGDLTARRLLDYSDGDLFWFAGHAVPMAEGDRWNLVDYLRALNTGEFVRTANRGGQQLRTPLFDAHCSDGASFGTGDLPGRVLRLAVAPRGPVGASPPEAAGHLMTIVLPDGGDGTRNDGACVAQPEATAAFAILLGTTPGELSGTELLVDPNGWLRARWQVAERGGWPTPERLAARVSALVDHPLPNGAPVAHVHH